MVEKVHNGNPSRRPTTLERVAPNGNHEPDLIAREDCDSSYLAVSQLIPESLAQTSETVAPLLDRASLLRTAHLRDPVGRRSRSPAKLCRRDRRSDRRRPGRLLPALSEGAKRLAVVKAAAERAGWEPRPSPRPDRNGDTLTGRGIAYAQRSGAVVAIVAEVEIDRHSGKV
jgi:hypothetical protein